jgi:RNA polymerase sigma-70 factor (sigma-E family)
MADRTSFAAFMRESSRSLQRTAWLLTGDWAAAEDLAQSALVKTWQRWESIEPAAAHAYTRRVMVTTFLGWRSRHWVGEVAFGWLPERHDVADQFDDVDVRETLMDALLMLPRQQRAVVVLRYFTDLSEAATAEALGCSVGTVKSHAARAVKSLRTAPGLAYLVDEGTDR